MTKMKREYNVLSTDDVMNHYAETAKKANNWKELPVQKAVMLVVAFKENFAMQLINGEKLDREEIRKHLKPLTKRTVCNATLDEYIRQAKVGLQESYTAQTQGWFIRIWNRVKAWFSA